MEPTYMHNNIVIEKKYHTNHSSIVKTKCNEYTKMQ